MNNSPSFTRSVYGRCQQTVASLLTGLERKATQPKENYQWVFPTHGQSLGPLLIQRFEGNQQQLIFYERKGFFLLPAVNCI